MFPKIDKLWLVALTSNTSDAGSDDVLNVTINIDGKDVVDENFFQERERGQGSLEEAEHTVDFDSAALTNTSIRLGTRGDDAWRPRHIMLLARRLRRLSDISICNGYGQQRLAEHGPG